MRAFLSGGGYESVATEAHMALGWDTIEKATAQGNALSFAFLDYGRDSRIVIMH